MEQSLFGKKIWQMGKGWSYVVYSIYCRVLRSGWPLLEKLELQEIWQLSGIRPKVGIVIEKICWKKCLLLTSHLGQCW